MATESNLKFLKRLDSLENGFGIDIYKIEIDKNRIRFLEDKVVRGEERIITVFARDTKRILQSFDLGKSWKDLVGEEEIGFEPYRFFTSVSGHRVIINDKGRIVILDKYLGKNPIFDGQLGDYPWHGSEGIDESSRGTICYSEYQAGDEDKAPIVQVWRSTPPYIQWKPVMARVGGVFPEGEIRHFHICRSDPFHKGKWWLFSGDVDEHIRGWVSNDDGISWQDLDVEWAPESLSASDKIQARRALRLTSIDFQEDKLLWGTDDNLGVGKAALITSKRNDSKLTLRLESLAGRNLFRNIMDLGFGGYKLLVTEAKSDISAAQIYLVNAHGEVCDFWDLENKRDESCFVTQSLGSRQFLNGTAFLPHYGKILDRKIGGILKLVISNQGDKNVL